MLVVRDARRRVRAGIWDATGFVKHHVSPKVTNFLIRLGSQAYEHLVSALEKMSAPSKVRDGFEYRFGCSTVPVDRLLLGGDTGCSAREFAGRTDDLRGPSTRLIDSPLFDLLRRTNPSDKEISASLYRRMARHCTDVGGSHLGANDDAGIAAIARALASGEHLPERQGQVAALVAPVRGSGYYQILDGDQRLAHAAFRGETSALVRIRRMPVTTPLQELLLQMSWLRGRKELYQPIDAPELRQGWTTVRRCTDRLEKMLALLADRKVAGSYLDVASCYGWFVAEMGKAGYDAYGVERDPLAIPLGRAAYGLRDDQIATGDALELLSSSSRTWDVVSCFSLLHHYVLDRRLPSPEELFKVLDRVTAKVLFIDMGQEHEEWLRRSLRGWNERSIAEFLRLHGTFTEVLDLGPDDDSRPPYAANYGRHLFACVRG